MFHSSFLPSSPIPSVPLQMPLLPSTSLPPARSLSLSISLFPLCQWRTVTRLVISARFEAGAVIRPPELAVGPHWQAGTMLTIHSRYYWGCCCNVAAFGRNSWWALLKRNNVRYIRSVGTHQGLRDKTHTLHGHRWEQWAAHFFFFCESAGGF